jgi:uncharacterized protein (DUF58 family)
MAFASSFPGFRLRLTRWGLAYLGACLVLGMAAVNTGNNALMALLSVALASYVLSGSWSRQVLGKVEVSVTLPTEIHAGRPVVVEVKLSNGSRTFPAYGLVIRDREGRMLVREMLLASRDRSRHSVEMEFSKRGWNDVGPWRLDVLLPLGFFLKSKELIRDERVLVYPRLLPSSGAVSWRGGGRRAAEALDNRGRQGEVTQLRDYREGDEVRQMHWKQTARQQRPVVVDRQRASENPLYFVVDPRLDNPQDQLQRERFEHMISEVATGVVERLRGGDPVGLVVGSLVVAPVRDSRSARRFLRPLAEIEPQAWTEAAPAPVAGERTVVFAADKVRK